MAGLQDLVTYKIIYKAKINKTISTDWIQQAWEETGPDSPLTKLIVELCILYVRPFSYSKDPGHFPHEVLLKVAARFAVTSTAITPKREPTPRKFYAGGFGSIKVEAEEWENFLEFYDPTESSELRVDDTYYRG